MTAVLFGAGLTLGVSALAVVVNKALAALDNRERKQQDKPQGENKNYDFIIKERDNDEDDTF